MKRGTRGALAERKRVAREAHEELDRLVAVTKKLAAAAPRTDLDVFALDLLRGAVRERLKTVNDKLNAAGVREPARDEILNKEED